MFGRRRAFGGACLAPIMLLIGAGSATASDAQVVRAATAVAGVERLAAQAATGSPAAVQALYDAARDLDESARVAAPATRPCRPLLGAVRAYARARVREAEGVDRLNAALRRAGQRSAARARGRVAGARGSCPGTGRARAPRSPVISPRSGEAFYGAVVVRAPAGVTAAQVTFGGTRSAKRPVRRGRVRFAIAAPAGRYDLAVRFFAAAARRGGVSSRGVWLVPRSARALTPATSLERAGSARLGAALPGGGRYRAAWVQDLSSGRAAAVNAGARFPAASTVKLGLLAAALPRLGARPADSPHFYDLSAMTRWSSNLATNRLLGRLGGSRTAERGLRLLGAPQSTFTGEYVVGTALQPRLPLVGVDQEPPRVSGRVTSAQDLAHMMFALTAAATGQPRARRQLGVTTQQARVALGWLLSSEQRGDNRSLVARGAPDGAIIAQKNGWIRAARLGASVIFARERALLVVVLAYDAGGVGLGEAQSIGAAAAGVARGL